MRPPFDYDKIICKDDVVAFQVIVFVMATARKQPPHLQVPFSAVAAQRLANQTVCKCLAQFRGIIGATITRLINDSVDDMQMTCVVS